MSIKPSRNDNIAAIAPYLRFGRRSNIPCHEQSIQRLGAAAGTLAPVHDRLQRRSTRDHSLFTHQWILMPKRQLGFCVLLIGRHGADLVCRLDVLHRQQSLDVSQNIARREGLY